MFSSLEISIFNSYKIIEISKNTFYKDDKYLTTFQINKKNHFLKKLIF